MKVRFILKEKDYLLLNNALTKHPHLKDGIGDIDGKAFDFENLTVEQDKFSKVRLAEFTVVRNTEHFKWRATTPTFSPVFFVNMHPSFRLRIIL